MAACTQDNDFTSTGSDLPARAYPLQISSLTVAPGTRVSESTDGMSSSFDAGDSFTVELDGETATYTVGSDGSITSPSPLYWSDRQTHTVTAWHTTGGSSSVNFGNQSAGLAYVLHGTGTGSISTPVALTFRHLLAKVRVQLGGATDGVSSVQVYGYTSCTYTQGTVSTDGAQQGWIEMHRVEGTDCWEANLAPVTTVNPSNFIRLNGNATATVTGITGLTAGTVSTLGITIIPTSATENPTGNISGSGSYVFRGNLTTPINITGGSPHVYLDGATVSVGSGPAINITGGSPTIHVVGKNNTVQCTGSTRGQEGAGIYVAESSSVTIQGSGRNDVLTAWAGCDGAGIGGYSTSTSTHLACGDITIKNVTIYAYSASTMSSSPGIGSRESCGTITMDNTTVYARGIGTTTVSNPAIGSYSSVPDIIISGSDIHAFRGSYSDISYADWIGRGGAAWDYQGGAIQGTITNTTVYKGKWDGRTETSEGSQVFE